jgi:hypothetical protein
MNPHAVDALQSPAAAVEAADPFAPVDAVKEPVGDDQQHGDGQQPRDRLQAQPAVAQRGNQGLGHEVGDSCGQQADRAADQYGAAQAPARPRERRGDGGEDEHRLEALVEHDHAGIGDHRGRAHLGVAQRGGHGLQV